MNNWKKQAFTFLFSQALSLFGSAVVSFSIVLYIALETSSGTLMSICTLCTFLPQIIISLPAGVWADRFNRKALIMLSDSFIALFTLLLVLLREAGFGGLWLIFVVSAIRSLGSGVQSPAVSAILPQLVPKEHLTRVNGINSTVNSLMLLASPAVGGALLYTWGLEATLLLDVLTAALAVGVMFFLPTPSTPKPEQPIGALGQLREGLTYAGKNPLVRYLLLFYMVFFFLITPAAFLTPLLVERSFGGEVWRVTANEMAWTIGGIIGGVGVSLWGGFKNRIYTMALSCAAFGLFFALLGLARNFTLYLGIMLLAGLFMPLFSVAETVLVQERVEENMLGRVFSLIQIIASAVMPLGMLLFGPLADVVKVEYIIIASGVVLWGLGVYMVTNKQVLEL